MADFPGFIRMSSAPMSRRNAIQLAGLTITAALCSQQKPEAAYALKPGKPSKEKLLNSIREERSPEEIAAEKERVAEERRQRLERQKELQAEAERRKNGLEDDKSKDTEIESNLRGQYYFPTARKRYLPRVKLAWETLEEAETAARDGNWRQLGDLSNGVLADAQLPLKLYASSLAGGGLNISSRFIEAMTREADRYEDGIKKLGKATKKRESTLAVSTLTDMRKAIEAYRKLGRLEAVDFGIGEIPTDTRIGSGFSNNNSALYNRNTSVQESKTFKKTAEQ